MTDNLEAGAGDLVERLLAAADHCAEQQAIHGNSIDGDCEPHWSSQLEMAEAETVCREAAAQLAAVTAENARLREALEPFAKIAVHYIIDTTTHLYAESEHGRFPMKRLWFRRARALLSQEAPK